MTSVPWKSEPLSPARLLSCPGLQQSWSWECSVEPETPETSWDSSEDVKNLLSSACSLTGPEQNNPEVDVTGQQNGKTTWNFVIHYFLSCLFSVRKTCTDLFHWWITSMEIPFSSAIYTLICSKLILKQLNLWGRQKKPFKIQTGFADSCLGQRCVLLSSSLPPLSCGNK